MKGFYYIYIYIYEYVYTRIMHKVCALWCLLWFGAGQFTNICQGYLTDIGAIIAPVRVKQSWKYE